MDALLNESAPVEVLAENIPSNAVAGRILEHRFPYFAQLFKAVHQK
jgi:hypothetical protein